LEVGGDIVMLRSPALAHHLIKIAKNNENVNLHMVDMASFLTNVMVTNTTAVPVQIKNTVNTI
jgi:hypothetical protein